MNEELNQKIEPSFKIFPTYSSSIVKMDNSYDPRLVIGILQGDKDLKGFSDYNLENKTRVLRNMDGLLANQVANTSMEEIAFYFNDISKKANANNAEINLLSEKFANHKTQQAAKIKSKPMPSPQPGNGLSKKALEEQENKVKHEIAQKKSFKNTPFPNPFKVPNT